MALRILPVLSAGPREIAEQQVNASAQFDICRQHATALPARSASGQVLPAGAVKRGDPDAPDAGAPGFIASFPGTRSKWGSFCYTYLCESNVWNVNPLPTANPRSVGHDEPATGDVALVCQTPKGPDRYLPVHFAVYQGNGASSIEIVNSNFCSNCPNAVILYVNRDTGK